MATQRLSIFGPQQDAPARKAAGSLRLVPAVKNDVFLNALLEMPTTIHKIALRAPLEVMPAPKGGSDEPVSVNRNVGDSGFSLRQRLRRFHSQQVSPLSSLRSAALDCGRLRVRARHRT
jgi:hypothetical protein